MNPISGVIAAMDTPFDDQGAVSPDRIKALVDFLFARGVKGFFLCGSTGLFSVLSVEERKMVARTVLDHLGGALPTLVNVGTPNTADSIILAEHAAQHGAQGVVLMEPVGVRHEQEAVYEHFGLICEAVPETSVYLYRRGMDSWSPDMLRRLGREFPNVVGVKDSAESISLHMQFLAIERCIVYQGFEPLASASILAGSNGLVSGLATVFPEEVVKLYDLIKSGSPEETAYQQQLVNRLVQVLYYPSPYRRFKAVLEERGCPVGTVRRPYRPITESEKKHLIKSLRAEGVL